MNLLQPDLDYVLAGTEGLWDELRGQRLFLTGGTQFVGCWLLESFARACEKLNLDAEVVVLTRSPSRFQAKVSHLARHPRIHLYEGDVRDFRFPQGKFSHVIHAATTDLTHQPPLGVLETIVGGTRHTLDFALACGARKFLYTSSGAVYGEPPANLEHVPETYAGAPDPLDPQSAYGEGKRMAELLCSIYCHEHRLETKIARCWSFVGPYLILDGELAIGNFIRDQLRGGRSSCGATAPPAAHICMQRT